MAEKNAFFVVLMQFFEKMDDNHLFKWGQLMTENIVGILCILEYLWRCTQCMNDGILKDHDKKMKKKNFLKKKVTRSRKKLSEKKMSAK